MATSANHEFTPHAHRIQAGAHTHSERSRTSQPCNQQQVVADTKGGMRWLVLSGVTEGRESVRKEKEEKDEGDNAKISSL